jgi:hypothetical protein
VALTPFDPVDDETSDREADELLKAIQNKRAAVPADYAQRVAQIYKQAPYIPASVILSMAKSGASQQAVDAVKPLAIKQTVNQMDPQRPQSKSWFQRNIYDKAKAASRWTFAGLQLLPDLAQNVGAEIFSPNDSEGFDGIFKSTQLGTLLANSDEAGDGFFLGGEAAKLQAERARDYRGVIEVEKAGKKNYQAWTIGRGAARLAFTPGSRAYNVMSGFVDAAVAIGADPTTIAGPQIKAARAARAAIPGITDEAALAGARAFARGEAGLDAAESIAFRQSAFGKFVTQDKRAVRLTERLAAIGADTTATPEMKTLRILTEFGDSIDPTTARRFAEADTVQKVQGLLGEASSRLAQNPDDILLPRDIRDIRLANRFGPAIDDAVSERIPLYRSMRNSKWWQNVPKGSVVVNGTGRDKTQAIRTYSNYLKGIGVDEASETYTKTMSQVVRAYSLDDPGAARAQIQNAYDEVFAVAIEKAGGNRELAQRLSDEARKYLADARAFNVDEVGWADDGGFMQMLRQYIPQGVLDQFPPDAWDRLVLQGPGALVELAEEVHVLPDFRQMRTLTSNPFVRKALLNKEGDQRGLLVGIEFLQNEIWKPAALATGGYVMRNMMDAQVRIAMGGLKGFFNHPVDYIQWALRKKGFEDILSGKFDDEIGKLAKNWSGEQDEFYEALTFNTYKNLEDTSVAKERMMRNGNFSLISRGVDRDAHTTGYVDNLAQLFGDDINQQVARIKLAEGVNEQTTLKRVRDWLFSDEGAKSREKLREYFKIGVRYVDPETGKTGYIKFGDEVSDEVLVQWVNKLSSFKVNTVVKDNKELRIVAAYNKVPLTETINGKTRVVGETRMFADDIMPNDIMSGDGGIGSVINMGDGQEGLIIARRTIKEGEPDFFTGVPTEGTRTQYIVQPVHKGDALQGDLGSVALRGLIDTLGDEGRLATVVKRAERGLPKDPDLAQKALKAKDRAVDFFFNNLYGRATQKLEKSPVFRQYYYNEVLASADLLAPEQARTLLDNIVRNAKETGVSPAKYVGNKKILDKLREVSASTSASAGTIEQLDQYAKAVALRQTKELLYNATERSNIEDIMRIMVPFGSAWKEVLGTYASAIIEDPTRIRRAQLVFDGARKFDPDGDGEGFFYRDPTTGEYSFNFPASGWISKLLTGQEAPLQAPVKRLSIGLGVVPSVGPVAQLAASQFLPDTPNTDFIASILIPYGRKEGLDIVPRWATRLKEVVEANTTNLQTVYGNTYIETLRALTTSGEYDLSRPEEQERLYADARGKARILAGMRVLGQFFGPTSPSAEFKIDTAAGDMYASELVKEFQKLQTENYDTAVSEFLRIYGNDAMLYLSNKSESLMGGLEATEEFADWERTNSNLFNKYPDVAGFMAPGGDDFSFEAWSRQLRTGKRRRLTDREIVAAAQYKIANDQYRALREKLPAKPSDEQKAWLRQWRVQLNKQYPGFPVVAEFNPGEFPGRIEQMKLMVKDPALQDNDAAQALAQYLDARDKAVEQYVQSGGAAGGFASALAAAPLRDWLANIGLALKEDTPEFARIYDRILSNEVEE